MAAAAALAGSGIAQTATFTPFGTGCYGASIAGTPPRLGMTAQISYFGPNSYVNPHGSVSILDHPALIFGLSNQVAGSLQLPWTFPSSLSLGFCQLLVSNEFAHWMDFDRTFTPPVRYLSVYQYQVPASSAFLGMQFYVQFVVQHYDSSGNPAYVAFGSSNAATAVVGL